MIALPEWQTFSKITTPEKVAASTGVWPISSVRNVMVKVNDTASFIAVARDTHGDKYDYSETVYAGSQQPIEIICKIHGKFRLAQAGTHYRKKSRACGCRKCQWNEVVKNRTGKEADRFKCQDCKKPLEKTELDYKKRCKDCAEKQRVASIKKKRCKGCDGFVKTSLKKNYCSHKCRRRKQNEYRESITVVSNCCVCGIEVVRKYKRDRYCCGQVCQMKLALVDNRGCVTEKDWIKHSENAKKNYKRKQSLARRRNSVGHTAMLIVRSFVNNTADDEWAKRIASARSLLAQRLQAFDGEGKQKLCDSWSKGIFDSVKSVRSKSRRNGEGEWLKKIRMIQGCLRRRRRLLNARLNT